MRLRRLAPIAGIANAVLVAAPPLALCGGAMTPGAWMFLVLLALAAAAETTAVERSGPRQDELPLLSRLSALALLCGFWLALAEQLLAGDAAGGAALALGIAALLTGVVLRVAAIDALGVDFVSEHRATRLVTAGLYGVLRHPSETGQLLLAAGGALLLASRWSAVWLLFIVLPLTLLRLRQEEAVLAARLQAYPVYRRRVDGLFPLRRLGRALRLAVRG
jgi:protein-S-isoprenylcysteine O-methyltransferase Ste14